MVIEYLNRKSRATLASLGLLTAIFIGQLDYVIGPMVALMAFYLIPICFVAWFAGRWPGILIAAVSSAIWFWAKFTTELKNNNEFRFYFTFCA